MNIIDSLKRAKALIIIVFGTTLLALGLALLFLPGPGILFIILGIAILSVEFEWARRLYKKFKKV